MNSPVAIPVSAIGRGRPRASPAKAPALHDASQPSQGHAFETEAGHHLMVVDRSRIYDVPATLSAALAQAALQGGAEAERALLAAEGLLLDEPAIDDGPLTAPLVTALALSIAQHCNLGCGYCYADGGGFGQGSEGQAPMDWAVARQAIDGLIGGLAPGATARIAFMGGEPLLARALLRRATEHASAECARRGLRLQLAITTNATVLDEEDAAFFAAHGFAVTVSLDGEAEVHDALRPTRGGSGSHARILSRLPALLARQGQAPLAGRAPMQASARITVTPRHRHLRASVEHLMALGFRSVGVSPSLSARDPALQIADDGFGALLAQMIECADAYEAHLLAGRDYPFANMLDAMRELHRGTHRPYPCGAGAGYLGVAADGELNACHRFVGDPRARFGDVSSGVDDAARQRWLAERHVHRQSPCSGCWARYLCGGGCHHEVLNRGRVACDFIRGWLDHCLKVYVRLSSQRPECFG